MGKVEKVEALEAFDRAGEGHGWSSMHGVESEDGGGGSVAEGAWKAETCPSWGLQGDELGRHRQANMVSTGLTPPQTADTTKTTRGLQTALLSRRAGLHHRRRWPMSSSKLLSLGG